MSKNTPNAAAISEIFANEDKPFTILPELRDFIDLPSDQELKELEASIKEEGRARDPLIIWEEHNAIVDGHNRYRICTALNLPFNVTRKSFEDLDAVKEWMLRNQLGRRNLSPVRVEYFIGILYNMQKKSGDQKMVNADGVTTAEKIAQSFNVSERTVRRAGDMAKGIDAVGRVHNVTNVIDKINAIQKKNDDQPGFTKDELQTIGKEPDPVVQEEAVKILTDMKKNETLAKAAVKKAVTVTKAKIEKKATNYGVVFCKPDFDKGEAKPTLAENAIVYIAAADEDMAKAIDLLKKWNLTYETTFIFQVERYEGLWSNVNHMFLVAASRGTVAGPKSKDASPSILHNKEEAEVAMVKLIEKYHKDGKRLDMRKNRNAKGWDNLNS